MPRSYPSVGSPEILPLSKQPQLTHSLAAKNLPALDETQLTATHAPNEPLGVLLVQFVVRGRALVWGQRVRMLFRQTEYGVRFGQCERNGTCERRKGGGGGRQGFGRRRRRW